MHLPTLLLLSLSLSLAVLPAQGLYFYLFGHERRCFIEELPKDTMVVGAYRMERWDEAGKKFWEDDSLGVDIHVMESSNEHVVLKQKGEHKGRFVFTSYDSDDYAICVQVNGTTGWWQNGKAKMHLEFLMGDHGTDITGPEDTSVGGLVTKTRDLNQKVADVRRDQSFQRDREASFRNRSENTNARVVWWSLAQAFVLGLTCWWQMRHLRGFFQAKKLV